MLDHITLLVSDYDRSKAFYLKALAPLGFELIMELTREQVPSLPCEKTMGMGISGKPELWLRTVDEEVRPTHLAFRARNRAEVHAFYDAALAAGGTDHGAPGLRAHYHPTYYGAFVLDPDGYNIEAVCHAPD